MLHLILGVHPARMFKPDAEVFKVTERDYRIVVRSAAVFTNWLGLKKKIEALGPSVDVTIDMSETHFVDHTVMEKLHDMEREFGGRGVHLHVVGLEEHKPFSSHPQAGRTKRRGSDTALPPAGV